MDKYYLTTPIYYVNAAPHIGHTYTTIAADVIKRYKQMQGFDVVLTTGTDEHGIKIQRSAEKAGQTPEAFTTAVANEFSATWRKFGFALDHEQRTTDPKHAANVQRLFKDCLANGYIYKGSYTGYYSVVNEAFVPDAKEGDVDPETGQPLEKITEENYFFKLSAFREKLIALHENNPDFLQPETRRNEVLAFLKQDLADLSITRTTIRWGIPVPDEPGHVFYVWFDALMAYHTAVAAEGRWPADLHLIGKEIVRFHAVYWPAFLMAAGWELPKKIFAHGWLLFDNNKMSKSRGNIVRPEPIRQAIGADALRYYLLREIVFGADGNFAYDAMVTRYNADLANGLGNLASRTLSMIQQYRGSIIPAPPAAAALPLANNIAAATAAAIDGYEKFEFSKGLEAIWQLIGAADKYIVEQAPWKLFKAKEDEKLDEVLYSIADALRAATLLAAPVLPESAAKIWRLLGYASPLTAERFGLLEAGQLPPGQTIPPVEPVFPRLEMQPTIDKMNELEEIEKARQDLLLGKTPEPAAPADPGGIPLASQITIDDFVKVDLRVGQVKFAEKVKGSDKLLHMKIDIGEAEPRTIVAGISQVYDPEAMLGRKVVIVANLAPRKLKGIESHGMIVAASTADGKPTVAGFLEDVPVGARLK
ncbi:MAG: methionine--tRNA ligase [Acidobacteriaceae bacterium]|nr:methionine--tRNA ligase [Acidobacteriaceae bacterium]